MLEWSVGDRIRTYSGRVGTIVGGPRSLFDGLPENYYEVEEDHRPKGQSGPTLMHRAYLRPLE